jgi:AraC-like DNA-binding protein
MNRKDNLVDADYVADLHGVSRRTVLRAAIKQNAATKLGNKYFVQPDVLGKDPSVAKAAQPLVGAITLQEAARRLGCSRSTVLRVCERTKLGIKVGSRRYVLERKLEDIKFNILKPGLPLRFHDPAEMKAHASRMARRLWRVRKSAKAV